MAKKPTPQRIGKPKPRKPSRQTTIFDRIDEKWQKQDLVAGSKKSQRWFQSVVKDMTSSATRRQIINDQKRKREGYRPGDMVAYVYDAKHADTLKFWDRFPLTIIIDKVPGGFRGINLHYLPIQVRVSLLSQIIKTRNNDRWDDTTKMQIMKTLGDEVWNHPIAGKGYKRYIFNRVRSPFIKIDPHLWQAAILLPVSNFEGASERQVWAATGTSKPKKKK